MFHSTECPGPSLSTLLAQTFKVKVSVCLQFAEPDSGCHITLDVLRAKMLEVVELLCQEPNNEPEDNTFAAVIGDYKCQDATFVTCFFSVMETLLPGKECFTLFEENIYVKAMALLAL